MLIPHVLVLHLEIWCICWLYSKIHYTWKFYVFMGLLQVVAKEQAEKKRAADEQFLERLEQVQLAEE